MSGRPSIIVVAGPTASGKSALGLQLAARLEGEVVNADSQQVYIGLDVGTAKAGPRERARVPHHLLDVLPIDGQLTAARFAELADEAIRDVARRGKVPLVVGGSGLWLRALLRGLAAAPPRDQDLRERLEAEAREGDPMLLHRRLAAVDPEAAARLHPNDHVRIIRALEVFEQSGEPLSSLQARHAFSRARYRHRLLALSPDRKELRERIAHRTEEMLRSGWLEETRALLDGGAGRDRLAKVLGYGEVASYIAGERSREETREAIATRTWRYAKRQLMWLRKEPSVEWLKTPVDPDDLAADLISWLPLSTDAKEKRLPPR